MKYFITTICICTIFFGLQIQSFSQNPKKAIELYEDFGYKTSIPLLEEIIDKKGMKKEDIERIANSYRLIHDTQNAEKWYQELVQLSSEPIHFLHYAQALQSNGNLNLAKQYFLLYDEKMGTNDKRGKLLAEAIDRMNEFEKTDILIKNERRINSDKTDFSPSFYKDGIVFVSSRPPAHGPKTKDIWLDDNFMTLFYTEKNPRQELKTPVEFSEKISTEYHEGPLTANRSGDQVFFTRTNESDGKKRKSKVETIRLSIYTAEKQGKDWGPATKLPFCTDEYDELHPSLSSDGKSLFFSSNREGGFGGMDLYVSYYKSGQWTNPRNLGATINTSGNESFPFIHDDGTLYFSSDGWGGIGGLDIFSSKKIDDVNWTKPENIGTPYNSSKDDFGFILNVLGNEGYLSSARDGGKGADDIYSFKLPPKQMNTPKLAPLTATLFIYDAKTQERISNVQVTIIEGIRDESGFVMDKSYAFKAVPNDKGEFSLVFEKNNTDTIGGYTYITQITDNNGEILYSLKPDKEYIFIARKPGYRLGQLMYTTEGMYEPTHLSFGIPLSGTDDQPELTADVKVGTVIELEKIYYDFDDYHIRPGATKSLDEAIAIMRLYPSMEIELSAHTDSRGTKKYNQELSIKRAISAREYIISRGISAKRLTSKGWGENKLRNNCSDGVPCTEEEHQYNRRTEITVTKFNRTDISIFYLNNPPEVIDPYVPEN